MAGDIISCNTFPQFLVDQQPYFDEMILEDIRPTDGWLGNVSMGTMPTGTPTEVTQDRFKHVYPNVTKQWVKTQAGSCVGTPCDKKEYCIGWGAERIHYFAEEQSWQTPLLCYDQDMHITHAEEHLAYIISDLLRPATNEISSTFLRKRALFWSKRKWIANKTQDDFTFEWTLGTGTNSDGEVFFDCSADPTKVFLLTPQMLQRRFAPLMRLGYAGKNPFKDTVAYIELVTDMDTLWNLDHLGGQVGVGGVPSVSGNWRFENFDAANNYWRYGFSGRIGNFLARADETGLRFNYVGRTGAAVQNAANVFRYQVVLPYVNKTTSGAGGAAGLGSDENEDFEKAHFTISFIGHKKGMQLLTMNATPINPEMPFSARDFGGKWQFVMDNLGTDVNGCVIENKRRNKGQFIADFKYYIRPLHTEFMEAIFHKREPICVAEVDTCSSDPGYPTQSYNSCNDACPTAGTLTITPVKAHATGTYEILVDTILCDGSPVGHDAITGSTSLSALAAQLNAKVPQLGTYVVNGSNIDIQNTTCGVVDFPFVG